jgi:hypothetical protein
MNTEFTAELERLRQMIFAVRGALHPEDVEASLLLHQIAERILALSEAAELAAEGAEGDDVTPLSTPPA